MSAVPYGIDYDSDDPDDDEDNDPDPLLDEEYVHLSICNRNNVCNTLFMQRWLQFTVLFVYFHFAHIVEFLLSFTFFPFTVTEKIMKSI